MRGYCILIFCTVYIYRKLLKPEKVQKPSEIRIREQLIFFRGNKTERDLLFLCSRSFLIRSKQHLLAASRRPFNNNHQNKRGMKQDRWKITREINSSFCENFIIKWLIGSFLSQDIIYIVHFFKHFIIRPNIFIYINVSGTLKIERNRHTYLLNRVWMNFWQPKVLLQQTIF